MTIMLKFRFRVTMCDYGEFVPDALKVSRNVHYRALGNKLDLIMEYNETLPLMMDGSHAFLESYTYGKILLSLMDYDVCSGSGPSLSLSLSVNQSSSTVW